MHSFSRLHLLELCLGPCHLLVISRSQFNVCPVLSNEIAIVLYWGNKVFL